MPVDWGQLAGSLVRTLRENAQQSQQEQQLGQSQQQLELEKQRLGLQTQQEKLNEQLSAPTIDSWKALQDYAKTLPPDQRAQLMMGVVAPSALKLQQQAGQVEQERQGALTALSGMMATAKPDDARVLSALMAEIASAPDLVTLRQAVNKANSISAAAGKPPPPIQFMPVPGGVVPLSRSSSGYSMGIPGVTSPAPGAAGTVPSGAPAPTGIPGMTVGPGGVPFIRKPTSAETSQADAVQQALDQIDALRPEIDSYAAESGPEPTGTLGKIGAAASRGAEYYGGYKLLGSTTPHSVAFTDASQLYAQIAGALMKGGTRSIRYLQQLSPHIPKATDSPQLLQEKIGKWRDILQREKGELDRGPFSPASGGAPAGDGGIRSPSPSRPDALPPDPGAVKTSAKGYRYFTDPSGKTLFLNPNSGRWEALD